MNEHARKWVEALRSGEFEQAQTALRIGDSYCCLGVACEVYRRETGDGEWHGELEPIQTFVTSGDRNMTCLAFPVMRWLGLQSPSGSYHGMSTALASSNDKGATFEEIAAIIESEPDGLFQGEAGSHDDA